MGGSSAGGFDSLFNQFFSGGASSGQRQRMRGQDVEYQLTISFHEAYHGSERSIQFQLKNGIKRELKVKVPAGIKSGKKLRISGKGYPAPGQGIAGDLYVNIDVASHPDFIRKNDDIEIELGLKISELLLGTSTSVKYMEGEKNKSSRWS